MKLRIALLTLPFLAIAVVVVAQMSMGQDKTKRPSPPASAACKFTDGKSIQIDYSSPRAKGRKIYGGLVPFGQVWRTGANEATSFVTTANLSIGGTAVPAGKYTLFTLPGESGWKLILNKETGQWGTKYDGAQDLARFDMSTSTLDAPVENFTVSFHEMGNGCHMYLDWERTRAVVELTEK